MSVAPDSPSPTPAVLLAGPTASGKSSLALILAERLGGTVINADSMQVYAELRVLTARPTAAEEALVPHRLYGHVPAAERYSVGRWLADLAAVLHDTAASGRIPIIVGGTGLYFKALTEGLAPVPEIPRPIREKWEARGAADGPAALHRLLEARDPQGAAAIEPADRGRVVRALEVIDATGRPLAEWQRAHPAVPLIDLPAAEKLILLPDRAVLTERIDRRFAEMVESGGLAEAAALAALDLDPKLPAMKAIGVRPLLDHIAGRIGLDMAIRKAGTETRRYAKRQSTWFRNQAPDWPVFADTAAIDPDAIAARLRKA